MPDSSDIDLAELTRRVVRDIEQYMYEVPAGAVGKPFSNKKVQRYLTEMRAALVDPYWITVALRDTWDQMSAPSPIHRTCAVVADNCRLSTLVAFDPIENDFCLIKASSDGFSTIGVRGDSVGCFMAI
jgi:hypothetical protein